MPDLYAFEPMTVEQRPSVTYYRGETYRSDRDYTDKRGHSWVYVGLLDGAAMWRCGSEDAIWNIKHLVDGFGPLADATASA